MGWAKPSAPPAAAAAATAALPFPADAAEEYVRNKYFDEANMLSELHASEWLWTLWVTALYKQHVDRLLSLQQHVQQTTGEREGGLRGGVNDGAVPATGAELGACGVSLHSKCDFSHRAASMPALMRHKRAPPYTALAQTARERSRRWNQTENSILARRRRRHVATFAGDGRD